VSLLGSHFESQRRDSNPERTLGKLFPDTAKTTGLQEGHCSEATTLTNCYRIQSWIDEFDVLTAVTVKGTIFWDVTLYSGVGELFARTYCLHLQG
jgi:hypothetical protein